MLGEEPKISAWRWVTAIIGVPTLMIVGIIILETFK